MYTVVTFVQILSVLRGFVSKGLFTWTQAGPVRRARKSRWDDFYSTFIWNVLPHFNQKVYVAGKTLFDQVVFTTNNDLKPLCRTKQSWLKKTLCRLAGLAHLRVFIWKIFISHKSGFSGKSSGISPRRSGSLLMWTHYIFIRVSLRKVRSHLGQLARLTEQAHLHINSP